jgi:subtilase family serine protease
MLVKSRFTGAALAAAILAGLTLFAGSASAQSAQAEPSRVHSRVCADRAGLAHCNAIRTAITGMTPAAATPSGLSPADLQSAYGLVSASATRGADQTIAIVDAYDAPTVEADLAIYRRYFGLPACTTANGCFTKVDQSGGSSYPAGNAGWAEEISLDVDMASAICPNCKILLVEATTASFANLGTAVNYASGRAGVVSNSYGGADARDARYGSYYNHPGVAITVSSGDAGYGVEYPASSHYVTAVGGTTLTRASGTTRGWSETAWSGAGSGCSTRNTALTSAPASLTGCNKRAVADVSAVADPATGVSVYDSTPYQGASGWLTFGGTSVAAPIIAGVFALAGNASVIDNNYPYTHSSSLNDVTSGSNGSCPTAQWCSAGTGWDGPTGLGTPKGTTAF